MSQVKLYTVLWTNASILMVFYTLGQCWQFRIVSRTGGVFGEQKIYYTVEAALTFNEIQNAKFKIMLGKIRKLLELINSGYKSPLISKMFEF
ncbi:hypothetical protein [Nostoc sp. FACHB-888]|uniref:hypothetical protein n=1 Tax=Nostoc sp. FACHB-888 TaxID=2692842 RepID=UPI0016847CD7|nr:hypothetical protein [Nostoc sp. FACHB-888]MBD2247454.1 hypothetical protein [Nostoc sp. FACHB-888]